MHLRNKPPLFVPQEYRAEVEQMSKAALMDLAWDLASQLVIEKDNNSIMDRLREGREVVNAYRANPDT